MISQGKIPGFFGFRIYFLSTLLYLLMVLPFAGFFGLQRMPELLDKQPSFINTETPQPEEQKKDTLFKFREPSTGLNGSVSLPQNDGNQDQSEDSNEAEQKTDMLTNSFSFLQSALILSFLAGFIFNYPFKRYFRRKRKGKKISPKLFRFCKKYILVSPVINVVIFGLAFFATVVYMAYLMWMAPEGSTPDDLIFIRFFYISLFSSILVSLFVYFWEKHRVHIKYLDFIFSKKELRKRIFKARLSRIKNRFWISSAMTTLLPLSIVIVYLVMSLTHIQELNLDNFSEEQIHILFGKYSSLLLAMGVTIEPENMSNLFFVNVMDGLIMAVGIGVGIVVSFVYILFFVKWTTQDIVYPVKELIYNMQKTGEGKTVNYTVVRSNDEIGELAEGYNIMTKKLESYIANISNLNEAYFRFVPKQFLEFLGKDSIVDVKLGDQIQKEMSVLFTDIRGFTSISEEMTPKENFDFLNGYLSNLEPVISRNHGFIDKYIGDSIMALFVGIVENAIDAAIEMRSALSDFNLQRKLENKAPIDSGIGIHTGNLMLGVVGGHGRMEGTVVSDAVNLASRIEGLTKMYGTSIIISQDTLIKMEDPSRYNYRFLDVVKVKGKKEAVYIFEILDGEPEQQKKLKIETKPDFGRALQLYKNKEFDEALKLFKKVNSINPKDRGAELYIARCKNILDFGIPEYWDGVGTLKDKY